MNVLHELEGKILVLDEAQELRRSRYRFDSILAYIYDHVDMKVAVSGSQIGLLYRFLRVNDPEAPLFGRPYVEVKLRRLDRDAARNFLIEGFKQEGAVVSDRLIEETLDLFDGVIGWLAYFGFAAARSREPIDSIVDKASRVAAREVAHALKVHGVAERSYREALKVAANLGAARWIEIKRAIEAKLGRIPNNALSTIIKNLVDSGFMEKADGKYRISDPVLRNGIRKFL